MQNQKERVLITGGTGFAGSHLAELLAQSPEKYELHLTHITSVPTSLRELLPTALFHEIDLTDLVAVRSLITEVNPTQIYQLASIPVVGDSFARATDIFQANTAVIHNLLEVVREIVPLARILVVTSAEVYGISISPKELPISEDHALRPVNPYGISKVTQDLLTDCYRRAFGLQLIRVRPFNHIGERQQVGFAISGFARQIVAIERGEATELHVGNLTSQRDFTDVKDVVRGYQLLLEKGIVGEVYNLGTGTALSMQSVVDQLCSYSTAPIEVVQEESRLRPSDIPIMQADASKARELGWQAKIPLSDTLQRILGYWRSL
ncbi:GDP-mannose 4,6-dehydratase [Candidatus Woesebacteria bacterium]|nr:GDP-mannose 4,6-dehydratase [Candidatus Woesebacteria bacterium]